VSKKGVIGHQRGLRFEGRMAYFDRRFRKRLKLWAGESMGDSWVAYTTDGNGGSEKGWAESTAVLFAWLLGVMKCHDRWEPARLGRGLVYAYFRTELFASGLALGT
jgi:hypothetical protein